MWLKMFIYFNQNKKVFWKISSTNEVYGGILWKKYALKYGTSYNIAPS